MARQHPALAHQFDTLEQQHEARTLGMWMFLASELMFFGGVFLGYLYARYYYPEAFDLGSDQLKVPLGAVNTVILLTSSLTMALAVHAAQIGRRQRLILFLSLTLALGAAFLGIKLFEYVEDYHKDLIPGPHFSYPAQEPLLRQVELFFWLYFAMTGLHALHMIIGMAMLAVLVAMAWRGRFDKENYSGIEVMGLYWHFVDIVWIFLFPLLYLI
jgi:cytochrome c oxidase subunit 3